MLSSQYDHRSLARPLAISSICPPGFCIESNIVVYHLFMRAGLADATITWDDYAIMSMVEIGLGISIIPELILQRIPCEILVKELEVPAYRDISVVAKEQKSLSFSAKRFLEYIDI
jgi:DNA-binding transcriptional LysR family regulator